MKMRRAISIFISLLAIQFTVQQAQAARGESCTSIDLRSDLLGPTYDQEDVGWCYAYAISDVLTQALGKRISPIVIGAMYANGRSDLVKNIILAFGGAANDGGMITTAFSLATKKALCAQEDESDFVKAGGVEATTDLVRRQTISIWHVCNKPMAPVKYKVSSSGPGVVESSRNETIPSLNEVLEAGQIPLITYNAAHVSPYVIGLGGHASTIVARRKMGNECQYLVRNSWGRDCHMYKPGIECEAGYYWLSEKQVKKTVRSVHALY